MINNINSKYDGKKEDHLKKENYDQAHSVTNPEGWDGVICL